MDRPIENYQRYLQAGLVITLLLIAGLTFALSGEKARLASAAESITAGRIRRGGSIYAAQCTACHGTKGEGGVGPALNNRTLLKTAPDSVFFAVIRSGVPNTQMPAWSVDYGGTLTDEDVRDVVAFLRSWEPKAPEIQVSKFTPDPARGALLFASTCMICHGENGSGTSRAPKLNDPARLQALPDDWYRGVIRNGRPAKGMPTWGTVLSPNQIEDIVSLIAAWRQGIQVAPKFSIPDLLSEAIFSLQNGDNQSAALQVERALSVAEGAGAEVLRNAQAQMTGGDYAGALATLNDLSAQWPLGDAAAGAEVYSADCSPCHGIQGEGGIGLKLNPSTFIQSQTNAQLLSFIKAGRTGTAMAGFSGRLNDTQLADVIAFLRLWQK